MLDKLGQTLAACGRRFQAEPPRAQGSDTWVDGSDKDNYKPESVVSDTQRTDSVVDVEEHASTKHTERRGSRFHISLPSCLNLKATLGSNQPDYKREYAPDTAQEAMMANYNVITKLSQGPCSRVDMMVHVQTGVKYAVKRETKAHRDDDVMHLVNEASIQSQLKHPNIASVEACYDLPNEFIMIQEFVGGGDLFDAVVPDIGCREKTLPYIHQLCSALAYMHSKNIVHRDLKPENICVSADKQAIKIIDFGLALQLDPSTRQSPKCGTVPYMAPETFGTGSNNTRGMICAGGYQDGGEDLVQRARELNQAMGPVDRIDLKKTDIWAAGVVLYTMLVGKFPWAHATFRSQEFSQFVRFGVEQGPFTNMPPRCKLLISRMLCINPNERITAQQAKELIESWTPGPQRVLQPPAAQTHINRREKRNLGLEVDPPPLSPFLNVTSCEFDWLSSSPVPEIGNEAALAHLRPEHINMTTA